MTVLQIRGTSGSGKTYVMRRIMDCVGDWQAEHIPGRKRPLLYQTLEGSEWGRLVVLGSYEATCGGCDTIGSARAVFDLVLDVQQRLNPNVTLCEGLLLSEDTKWSSQLQDLKIYYLSTPLECCLAQIKQRRLATGNDKELNPANTANRVKVIERSKLKLEELGVWCRRCPADQCVRLILDRLRRNGKENTNA